MYSTISKTPRIFIWVQSGPEFCACGPRNIMRANATRTPVGSQSVHSRIAARTQHACMHGPSASSHLAAPGPPRRSLWLQMARRWRPEMGGKQSEHHGQRAAGIGMCMRADGQTCASAPLLSPWGKIIRAQFRGWDPSTGWAGPCTIECTPSRVWRAPSATPRMKVACDLRALVDPSACASGQGILSS